MLRVIAITLAVLAALWSGLWFYGRGVVQDALETQKEQLRAKGGDLELDTMKIGGFPFGYRGSGEALNVRVPMTIEDGAYAGQKTLIVDGGSFEAKVSAFSPRTVAFELPPEQNLRLEPVSGGDAHIEVRIGSEGLSGTVTQRGEAVASALNAAVLRVVASLASTDDLDGMLMTFAGRNVESSMRAAGSDLEAGPVAVSFDVEDFSKAAEIVQGGAFGALVTEAQAATLSGEATIDAEWADVSSKFNGLQMQMIDPVFLQLEAGKGETEARFPHGAGAGERRFDARLDIEEITLDDAVFAQFSSADTALLRDLDQIAVSFGGTLREGAALIDVMRAREPLALLETFDFSELRLAGLGLEIDGEGRAGRVAGELAATATIDVLGLDAFIERAVRSGLIPPTQAIMGRLMINNVAREGRTPEHKRFEIVISEGLTRINGAAFGLAPKL